MTMRGAAHNNAKALGEALGKAERQLSTLGRPSDTEAFVKLHPSEIKIRPELFQPREFLFGVRGTNPEHVKRLERAIGINGELDPVLVVKLGKTFICVDGHHRIKAYEAAKWRESIRCEWFGGTLRQAVDESMLRNGKDRLNVPPADRREQAWKRVLLEWGSKKQIKQTCGVSDGTVALMRRVFECWRDQRSKLGKEFRRSLKGHSLHETNWVQARLAYHGVEEREINDELKAVRLAKRIRARLEDLLSRDPKVTARALGLYDPKLPELLQQEWRTPNAITAIADEEGQEGGEGDESNAAEAAFSSGADKAL
jgi:ParB-like chromosome segregation protein Spo0J